jgi:hypothetical protein
MGIKTDKTYLSAWAVAEEFFFSYYLLPFSMGSYIAFLKYSLFRDALDST